MIGPGIYDGVCTKIRTDTQADAVLLVVAGGRFGSGFSVQAAQTPGIIAALPALLREVAGQIELDAAMLRRAKESN